MDPLSRYWHGHACLLQGQEKAPLQVVFAIFGLDSTIIICIIQLKGNYPATPYLCLVPISVKLFESMENIENIVIHHKCEDVIEKSVPSIIIWNHEACL